MHKSFFSEALAEWKSAANVAAKLATNESLRSFSTLDEEVWASSGDTSIQVSTQDARGLEGDNRSGSVGGPAVARKARPLAS